MNVNNFGQTMAVPLSLALFIYPSLLVEGFRRIKVRVLQKFEDFSIEIFLQIYSFDDAQNLQNSAVPSFRSLVTFQPVDVDKTKDHFLKF